MKWIRVILLTGMWIISSTLFAQSKGEMPFESSSTEAKQLLRNAWVAYGDAKYEDAQSFVSKALQKDPEFGLAHAFLSVGEGAEHEQNLRKISGSRLSADEKLLIDGLRVSQTTESVANYFEPLLKKYPKDYYLNLLIMSNYHNTKRSVEIGEMIAKRNPKFAPVYNILGNDYMARGEFKSAETNFDKYIALRPDQANAYDAKANYLMRVGQIEGAIALFEKAAALGMTSSAGRADVAKAKLKFSSPSDKDKQEIKDLINASSAAYVKGDVDEILKPFSDQSIELFPDQRINAGVANIRARLGFLKNVSFSKFNYRMDSIQGAGNIALAWGQTESASKSGSDENMDERKSDDIFLLRKQDDGQWKILAHHWQPSGTDATAQPSKDNAEIRQVIDQWSFFIKPGALLSQEHVEILTPIHSSQGVEILSDQRSNIGIANLRVRWTGFIGIKWAQFTGYKFDVNSFALVGSPGAARMAVAWGIGDHSNYWDGSTQLAKFLFPWAMILTKEKDDKWRILVYHFYVE
jgi:tetratricopeptide (TPR) repeat protein